ncbi:aldehyde dehydrogenase family protein, partial [Salmonella enterica]|uniref:aldehyde dehydrogenase family protein n=1 Tax=Salmonella enterica TaxID=28901 RepID=UPI00187954D7
SHVAGRIAPGTGEVIAVDDPATGAPLYAYQDAGETVVAEAAAAAVRAQGAWARLTGAARGRLMQAIARAIQD